MSDLRTLIDTYPDLSCEDRATVRARVEYRPELSALLDRARQLADLVDAARAEDTDIERAERDVDAWLRGDNAPEDPLASRPFRDLLARSSEALGTGESSAGEPPAGDAPAGNAQQPAQPSQPDPPPVVRWGPRLVGVVGVAALLYGALGIASMLSLSERDQVAELSDVKAERIGEADRLYAALDAVRDARRSVLGLFPRYDAEALDATAGELASVAGDASPRSWQSQEARLALGRIHLYRQRDAEAARVLGSLVSDGDYRAPVARRLLDYIRSSGEASASGR
ncbi:MAG: hypothetical protein AAGK21_03610 [Bacteroidota bacterium]